MNNPLDELFSLYCMKRLKMPPEEVAAACGGDTQFPLKGDERIVIYRPKT